MQVYTVTDQNKANKIVFLKRMRLAVLQGRFFWWDTKLYTTLF
jgi:hypothetical protein